jgi:hypothetical protein
MPKLLLLIHLEASFPSFIVAFEIIHSKPQLRDQCFTLENKFPVAILSHLLAHDQGCLIFLGPNNPKHKKCTK